jgi:peptidoglycan/xylan/chitin deacetylase (PgdA/CDA1 family)
MVVWVTITFACIKQIPVGRLDDGYIALTFDDSSVANWYTNLPILESFGIKATFYISNYHSLTDDDKLLLKKIRDKGHEIAYQTTNHKDLVKLLYSSSDGWNKVHEEINTDLELMQKDGFMITDFSYPYGSYDAALNRALLKTFRTVRALTNQTNFYQSLAAEAGCEKQVLFGAHVDNQTFLSIGELGRLLTKAKQRKCCAILVAHQINRPNSKYQIDTNKLRFIADKAKELDLRFITIDHLH